MDTASAERTEVGIPIQDATLAGDLIVPSKATGLVIFAHGSGSSRLSVRNRFVAETLNARGLATLLLDLLTQEEGTVRANVFDVRLLANRLLAATRWADRSTEVGGLPHGYFGASTGAAAALWATAEVGGGIHAVVSRGGRPDLAEERLGDVTAPTLLIVGGNDWTVIDLNEQAASLLNCPHELAIVPDATHLFEEPGALERVAELAGGWLEKYLPT